MRTTWSCARCWWGIGEERGLGFAAALMHFVRVHPASGMVGEIGSALSAARQGFPDETLVAVAGAMDGRADWEETLAGFVERWVERSEALMRMRAMVLNTVLLSVGTAQMLLIMWVSFDISTQVERSY